MPFTKYGRYELIQFSLLALTLAALSGFGLSAWVSPYLGWPLAGAFLLGGAFVCNFFRDPHRVITGDAFDIVSPADGAVTDATTGVECADYVGGKAHMLGIFLNVFDVHVNRAPLDSEVEWLQYRPGKFLDARHPDCGKINEQQLIGMKALKANNAKCLVKQISGAIARRIVCPLEPGARLSRGERFGMIKFGSRTELWIEAGACDVEWLVKPGDKVKGGATIVGRVKLKASATDLTTKGHQEAQRISND